MLYDERPVPKAQQYFILGIAAASVIVLVMVGLAAGLGPFTAVLAIPLLGLVTVCRVVALVEPKKLQRKPDPDGVQYWE